MSFIPKSFSYGIVLSTIVVLQASDCMGIDQKSERSNEVKKNTQDSLVEESHLLGGEKSETVLELLREIRKMRGFASSKNKESELQSKGFVVLEVVEQQRVLVIAGGLESGFNVGNLLKIGAENSYAKIVDSRSNVSAAVVENSFKGKLADLLGSSVYFAAK